MSTDSNSPREGEGPKRPFIGMHFTCCHVYARIYLNKDEMVFRGRCPRCGAVAEIRAAAGGSRSKFWSAG